MGRAQLHDGLGFRPRDQRVRGDAEGEAPEPRRASEAAIPASVPAAALDQRKRSVSGAARRALGMGDHLCGLDPQDVAGGRAQGAVSMPAA
jgi:hypothetical protein